MTIIYLKSALKSDSFAASIGIKIPFFTVSVTIEPGCLLLTVRYQKLFDFQNYFSNYKRFLNTSVSLKMSH